MKTYKILAVAFVAMIFIPAVSHLWGDRCGTASIEKRKMAQKPDMKLLWQSFSEFATRFEGFYEDNLSLRERLLRWNNWAYLALFHESPINGVRVGKADWLYYADEWNMEDYENVMPYSQDDLQKICRILEQRSKWLARRGMRFFVLIAPNKETIYPEYLPPEVHKIGRESRLDQVARYLRQCPDIEFIDVREQLLEGKRNTRTYHRTDSHWNDYGAFLGYTELMNRIRKYFPTVKVLTQNDFAIEVRQEPGGDLANMLCMQDLIHEERITMVPRYTLRATDSTRVYPDLVAMPGREMVVKETNDLTLPKALVFRDSFACALIPYLSESFRSVVYLWTFDFLPEIIEQEEPKVVILESVERYINSLMLESPKEVKARRDTT